MFSVCALFLFLVLYLRSVLLCCSSFCLVFLYLLCCFFWSECSVRVLCAIFLIVIVCVVWGVRNVLLAKKQTHTRAHAVFSSSSFRIHSRVFFVWSFPFFSIPQINIQISTIHKNICSDIYYTRIFSPRNVNFSIINVHWSRSRSSRSGGIQTISRRRNNLWEDREACIGKSEFSQSNIYATYSR